mmetsp:Transcript_2284/g.6579  ORF Transcript_2284/g.6579 Transcript_2284/m.6579 type:complete len:106 (+) Transcript_2284:1121-1438(+)
MFFLRGLSVLLACWSSDLSSFSHLSAYFSSFVHGTLARCGRLPDQVPEEGVTPSHAPASLCSYVEQEDMVSIRVGLVENEAVCEFRTVWNVVSVVCNMNVRQGDT